MNGLQPSAIEQAPVQTGIQAVPVTGSPVTAPVYAPSPAQQYTNITPQSTEVNLPSVKQPGTGEIVGSVAQGLATRYIGKAAVSAVKGYLASSGAAAAGTGAYMTGGALGFSTLPSVASAGTAAAGTAAGATAAGAAATGTLGSAAAGASTALGTIASYAGPMALGYFGGTLMSKITGGNPVGSGIGGAAGVGTALAAGLGPVGLLLGGIAGSAIGGLFGNKKPSGKAAGGRFNPFTGETTYFAAKGGDNVGLWNEQKGRIVSSVDRMQTILKLEDKIFQDTGLMQKGFLAPGFEVSSRDTTAYYLGGEPGKQERVGSYGVGDFETLQSGMVRGIATNLATKSGLSIEQKYRDRILNSKAKSVSEFLDDLEFGLNREDMPKPGAGMNMGTITDDQSFEEFLRTWNQSR